MKVKKPLFLQSFKAILSGINSNFAPSVYLFEFRLFKMKKLLPLDIFQGIYKGLWYSRLYIFQSFVVIPFGLLILLTILYGFNQLLVNVIKIQFPCSVLGMLLNLLILCSLNALSSVWNAPKHHKSWKGKVSLGCAWLLDHYLMLIKPSMNFCLKWINVFFIPSFIMLPLSQPISFVECMKIAAVFVVGGLLLMVLDVYMVLGMKYFLLLLGFVASKADEGKLSESEDNENFEDDEDVEEQDSTGSHELAIELQNLEKLGFSISDDITTIDLDELQRARNQLINDIGQMDPFVDQSLQSGNQSLQFGPRSNSVTPSPPTQVSSSNVKTGLPKDKLHSPSTETYHLETNLTGQARMAAIFVSNYIDWFLYAALFLISLPFYYISSIHVMLPYHLGLTVFAYYMALLIPLRFPQLKKFAHPILILTFIILFVCFIGSLIYHKGQLVGFLDDLKYFKTGKNYLNLFSGIAYYDNGVVVPANVLAQKFTAHPQWPGCGDFLSSLMDVSIVSLSLPMFTHRKDFVKNFWVLMPPLLVSTAATFFTYPIVCYKIGISSERSIGFIGRSVTLALGTPLINSLSGSVSLMAVCTILSGICGVLIGDLFFKLLRIPENDFITRGVTLGINCGAIATAHLLNIDPRAASISSLSFSVFGTIMVIMASIGAVRELIRTWVGL